MNIKMSNSSELNTLLIATTVFAIGGLGLFMYNSDKTVDHDDDDADSQSDSGSDFSLGEEELDTILDGDFDEEEEESSKKPKKGQTKRASNRNSKTKKNSR